MASHRPTRPPMDKEDTDKSSFQYRSTIKANLTLLTCHKTESATGPVKGTFVLPDESMPGHTYKVFIHPRGGVALAVEFLATYKNREYQLRD